MQQKIARFIQRHNLSTIWSDVNPILARGELGFETDTGSLKVGDGSTHWNNLAYITNGLNPYQFYTASNGLVLNTQTNVLSAALDYDIIYARKDLWYLKALNNVVVENIAFLTSGIAKDASSNNIFYIGTEAALSLQYGQLNAITDTSFLSLVNLNINQTLFQTIANIIFTTIPTLSVWLDSEDKSVIHDTEFNTQVTAAVTTSSDIREIVSCVYNSQVCGETEAQVPMLDLSFFNLSTIANIYVSDIWLISSISRHIINLFACLSVLQIVELNTLNTFILNIESSLKVTKLDHYAIINDQLIFDNSAQLYSIISTSIQSDNEILLNEEAQLNVVMGQPIKAITTQYVNSAAYCAIILDPISLKLLTPIELSTSIYLNTIIGAELQAQAHNSLLSSVYLTYAQTRLYNSDKLYFNSYNFLQNASTSLLQNVLETTLSGQAFATILTSVDHQTEANWQFKTNAHFVVLIYPWQSNDLLMVRQTYGHIKEEANYLVLN